MPPKVRTAVVLLCLTALCYLISEYVALYTKKVSWYSLPQLLPGEVGISSAGEIFTSICRVLLSLFFMKIFCPRDQARFLRGVDFVPVVRKKSNFRPRSAILTAINFYRFENFGESYNNNVMWTFSHRDLSYLVGFHSIVVRLTLLCQC